MKKTLIITYYWPPAGGPGVQRWLKFVKYLPQFGIQPIVYVPENADYPIIDESLLNEIPSEAVILKHPIKEPYKFARLLSGSKTDSISKGILHEPGSAGLIERFLLYIRGNFFIPDARKAWVKPSVQFLENYIQKNAIETIVTTGPPHSLHLIGLKLKQTMKLKWVADFRDPWTTIGYHKKLRLTKAAAKKHKELESEVLNNANQLIVTSQVTKREFEKITDRPIQVITNGYDVQPPTNPILDRKFTLSHIGSLLSERNPEVLWEVLEELINDDDSFSEHFELKLIGTVSNEVIESIKKYNLDSHTKVIGYVPHDEAIKNQRQSQVLLLIEIDSEDTKCIIPGKLFEYLVSHRPILGLGPQDSDVEQIINETNSGTYFNYSEKAALKSTIIGYFEDYRNGNLKTNPTGIEKYSRRALTQSLIQVL